MSAQEISISYRQIGSEKIELMEVAVSDCPKSPAGKLGPHSRKLLSVTDESDFEGKLAIDPEDILPSTLGVSATQMRVKTPETFPWRYVCRLEIKGGDGRQWSGTGFLVGPRLVLTAGRAIYDPDMLGGWAVSVSVHIGGVDEPVVSKDLRTTSEWADLGGILLPEDTPENHGFFSLADSSKAPGAINIAGYPPLFGSANLIQIQETLKNQRKLTHTLPGGLVGAPIFTVSSGGVATVYGLFRGDGASAKLTIFNDVMNATIYHWMGCTKSKKKRQQKQITRPTQIPMEAQPHLFYLTGDISDDPPAQIKRDWDTLLFGSRLGRSSSHFHYRDLLPGTDIPLLPGAELLEGTEEFVKKRFGANGLGFFRGLQHDIRVTGDSALLFGVVTGLQWLNMALSYFYPPRWTSGDPEEAVQNPGPMNIRKRLQSELIEMGKAKRSPVVVTHGFGAVILYDALVNWPDDEPIEIAQVIALANPLSYRTFRKQFTKHRGKRGVLKMPKNVRFWLDLSIDCDPVAADAGCFSESEGIESGQIYEYFETARVNESTLRQQKVAAYLRLPELTKHLSTLLPENFGAPVGQFVFARDVAEPMADPNVRIPTLIELEEPATGESDSLEARAREMLRLVLKAASFDSRNDNRKNLHLDRMRRYIAADLFAGDLMRLERFLLSENKQVTKNRVWRNSEMRALVYESAKAVQAGAARQTYDADGAEIHWAVLDSGIDPAHDHFAKHGNIVARWDFIESNVVIENQRASWNEDVEVAANFPHLGSGHGTHVAAILAGEEKGAPGVGRSSCIGVAPKTKLHNYRVLDEQGRGRESSVIRALEHIYQVNAASQTLVIHGVNLSLGCLADPAVYGCGHSPICRELRRLWGQGVIVCVAAGNAGVLDLGAAGVDAMTANALHGMSLDISIGDPANLEECIAVGSVHKVRPHTYGVSYFSSRGPTADGRMKPDCVAPGERIISAKAGGHSNEYCEYSGTSMSCPHVSGVIAAFLSRKREFIGQPDRVKEILLECCIDLKRDRYHQGAGIPNLMEMLRRY